MMYDMRNMYHVFFVMKREISNPYLREISLVGHLKKSYFLLISFSNYSHALLYILDLNLVCESSYIFIENRKYI